MTIPITNRLINAGTSDGDMSTVERAAALQQSLTDSAAMTEQLLREVQTSLQSGITTNSGDIAVLQAANNGVVLQREYNSTGDKIQAGVGAFIPRDNTVPLYNEGTTALSVSITPLVSTSILRVLVNLQVCADADFASVTVALFKDGADSDPAVAVGSAATSNNTPQSATICYEVVAGGTSAITFEARFGSHTGQPVVNGNGTMNTQYFGGKSCSSIEVMEIKA